MLSTCCCLFMKSDELSKFMNMYCGADTDTLNRWIITDSLWLKAMSQHLSWFWLSRQCVRRGVVTGETIGLCGYLEYQPVASSLTGHRSLTEAFLCTAPLCPRTLCSMCSQHQPHICCLLSAQEIKQCARWAHFHSLGFHSFDRNPKRDNVKLWYFV